MYRNFVGVALVGDKVLALQRNAVRVWVKVAWIPEIFLTQVRAKIVFNRHQPVYHVKAVAMAF